jgi:hypothetical protein
LSWKKVFFSRKEKDFRRGERRFMKLKVLFEQICPRHRLPNTESIERLRHGTCEKWECKLILLYLLHQVPKLATCSSDDLNPLLRAPQRVRTVEFLISLPPAQTETTPDAAQWKKSLSMIFIKGSGFFSQVLLLL